MFKFLSNLKEKHDLKTLLFHSSWALTLTSGMSYMMGFMRDRVFTDRFELTRINDVYQAASALPEALLNIFIVSALSAAFLPIFTKQYDEKKSKGYAYAHQVLSWGLMLIVVIGAIMAIFLPQLTPFLAEGFEGQDLQNYILLTRVMLISTLIFTLSNTYGHVLISVKEFLWYGLSASFFNAGIILGALYFYPHFGISGLGMGAILGALMHFLIRWLTLRRQKYGFRFKLNFTFSPEIKETIKLTLPKILQYSMWSFMILSFTNITSSMSEGSVAAYGYARNFQSLPVSFLGIAIALAMYPTLSHDAGKGNFQKFTHDFKRNRFRAIFYTTGAAIVLALVSKWMLGVLFNLTPENTTFVAQVLMIYCISIPFESLLHIYHRAFYSLKNTLIPALMHTFTILTTIVLARLLSGGLEIEWLNLSINVLPNIDIFAIPVSFAAGLVMHITVLASIFPLLLKRRQREAQVSAS